jgi:high-affinity iron transporter
MIAAFVIFLREGVEGSMIVAILLAYLQRRGLARHFRDVFVGVAAALVLTVAGGVVLYLALSRYAGSRVQTYVETSTYVVAAASMTAMTFWMRQHARTMAAELESRSDQALTTGNRWALGLLAFQSVGREGLETMVLTLAILFANSHQSATPQHGGLVLWGGALGLAAALVFALAMYRLGRTVNVKVFFRVLGIALMLFAAGLLADVVENLQQLGWVTTGSHVLWNSTSVMNESSNVGDVLHSLLGYAAQPTVLQALVWLTYLTASVGTFVFLGRRSPSRR